MHLCKKRIVLALLVCALPANAALIYDEAVSGDLSDDASAPTTLTLLEGENEISGTIGTAATDFRDFFLLSAPTLEIIAINVLEFTQGPNNVVSRLDNCVIGTPCDAFADGNTYVFAAIDSPAVNVIDVALFGSDLFGLQESDGPATYTLQIVTAVPIPASIFLFGGALMTLGLRKKSR